MKDYIPKKTGETTPKAEVRNRNSFVFLYLPIKIWKFKNLPCVPLRKPLKMNQLFTGRMGPKKKGVGCW